LKIGFPGEKHGSFLTGSDLLSGEIWEDAKSETEVRWRLRHASRKRSESHQFGSDCSSRIIDCEGFLSGATKE
jgi:hypothetical protein